MGENHFWVRPSPWCTEFVLLAAAISYSTPQLVHPSRTREHDSALASVLRGDWKGKLSPVRRGRHLCDTAQPLGRAGVVHDRCRAVAHPRPPTRRPLQPQTLTARYR